MAFLYNEMEERESREFERHLHTCSNCREQLASFGVVRESITAWRYEALSGFVSTPVAATAKKKSAIAALREFFDLSPLWLKGATGFAVVAFCVLAALAITNRTERSSAGPTVAGYTQQDVDRFVKEALANQKPATPVRPEEKPVVIAQSPKPKRATTQRQFAKSRRPLTRAEREQLAADLRLLSTDDEPRLNLLGDRINQ
jgi:anti-sigma factor RsiW